MKIGHLELFVKDPLISKDFYESVLGFEVAAEQGPEYIWLRSGEIELLLRKGNPASSPTYEAANSAIVLYTGDLTGTAEQLAQRDVGLCDMPGSAGCLAFTDPDGHWFQLVNPDDFS